MSEQEADEQRALKGGSSWVSVQEGSACCDTPTTQPGLRRGAFLSAVSSEILEVVGL